MSGGSVELSARWIGVTASLRTRPIALVGGLMPSSEASVTAKSTGSA
jgi:hypothetical protein